MTISRTIPAEATGARICRAAVRTGVGLRRCPRSQSVMVRRTAAPAVVSPTGRQSIYSNDDKPPCRAPCGVDAFVSVPLPIRDFSASALAGAFQAAVAISGVNRPCSSLSSQDGSVVSHGKDHGGSRWISPAEITAENFGVAT